MTADADTHVMSLRLPPQDAEQLRLMATVDGQTVSDLIRTAIRAYVDQRRAEPEFQERTRAYLERQQQLILGEQT